MDRPISKFKSFRRAPALISILTARIKEPLLRKQQQRQYRNAVITITMLNLSKPCVLYIGRAHRYPPNTPFYNFF